MVTSCAAVQKRDQIIDDFQTNFVVHHLFEVDELDEELYPNQSLEEINQTLEEIRQALRDEENQESE